MQLYILSHSIQVNRHGDLSFVMTQRLEKCLCVKCYSSVKPQSDRLVEDKQAHTSHKMKNSDKSLDASFLLIFNLKS